MTAVRPSPVRGRPISVARGVPVPSAALRPLLAADPGAVVGSASTVPGDGLRVGVPLFGSRRIEREVRIGFGPLVEEADGSLALPLWWEAAEHPRLFPTFDGGLEVGDHETGAELRLRGSYRPPLGRVGAFADDVAGFRAARATLEAFLDDVADRLSRQELAPGQAL